MKKFTYLVPVITLLGCVGVATVTKRPNAEFVPRSTITVVQKGEDRHNVQGQIEDILFQKGYNVVSERVARDQVKIETDAQAKNNKASVYTSISRVKEVNSVYLLSFSYSTRDDIPLGEVFESFTASIVDLADGSLVASLKYSQGAFSTESIAAALKKTFKGL